jgi:hypothetical protein
MAVYVFRNLKSGCEILSGSVVRFSKTEDCPCSRKNDTLIRSK